MQNSSKGLLTAVFQLKFGRNIELWLAVYLVADELDIRVVQNVKFFISRQVIEPEYEIQAVGKLSKSHVHLIHFLLRVRNVDAFVVVLLEGVDLKDSRYIVAD